MVTDHSDGLGFFPQLLAGDPKMLADPQGRKWYNLIQDGKGADAAVDIIISFSQGTFPKAHRSRCPAPPPSATPGGDNIEAADQANDPGRFTAFIGYEWTSNTGGNNLHRNVIFRDNGLKAGQVEPLTTLKPLGSDNPRDLWKWMAAYEEKTGGNVLAIAHNGNLSNGRMFPIVESFTGKPVDREYAEQRAQLGAPLRGDADQGRRRGPPVPVAQRRVRRLRALGQGQPRPQRTQEERDAGVRVRPVGAEERPQARNRSWGRTPTSSA